MPITHKIAAAAAGETPVFTGEELPPKAARRRRRLAAETKGDRTPSMVSCPLLTPLTFLCADTSEMCSETGVTGARFRASVRFWDAVMP